MTRTRPRMSRSTTFVAHERRRAPAGGTQPRPYTPVRRGMVLESRTSVSPRGAKDAASPAQPRRAPVRRTPDPLDPTETELTARGLVDEAQAAVSESANTLRGIRERYRTAHTSQLERWEKLRRRVGKTNPRNGNATEALRRDEAVAGREVGHERATLT